MIKIKQTGSFNNTEKFLRKVKISNHTSILEKYAKQGVLALASATPKDSGETASSWNYEIVKTSRGASINFTNSHMENGAPIAILIQYGHATKNGGYVQGRDYINPVVQPIFDKIAEDIWMEVTKI